jgi:hypothetical protein
MSHNIDPSLLTLPIELVCRILDQLDPLDILCCVRDVCTRINAITDTYLPYQVKVSFAFEEISEKITHGDPPVSKVTWEVGRSIFPNHCSYLSTGIYWALREWIPTLELTDWSHRGNTVSKQGNIKINELNDSTIWSVLYRRHCWHWIWCGISSVLAVLNISWILWNLTRWTMLTYALYAERLIL